MEIYEQTKPKEWNEWVNSRPPVVKDLCLRFTPTTLYKIKNTGQKCTVVSYNEHGTMTVDILYSVYEVFGLFPDDLVEVDI